ncbi:MAG: class D sortase [Xanthomonadales bacterium]|nr:class D sortase [Xanthomonadales bacterium]
MQQNLKRHLRWLEAGLYLGGVALLAVFFFLRFEGERQREAGIEAFQLAANSLVGQAQASDMRVALGNPESREVLEATVAAPDVGLWTEKRIREYEESLRVEADPPLAVMTIAKLGIQVPVYDGTDDFNLNRGVGRIEGTAMVSGEGNLGVAGHRDSFFRGLKDIAIGDAIDLLTMNGKEFYTVSSIEIVDPGDVWVLAPSETKTITLVTCYPFYYVGHAPKRYIVKATAEHSFAKN